MRLLTKQISRINYYLIIVYDKGNGLKTVTCNFIYILTFRQLEKQGYAVHRPVGVPVDAIALLPTLLRRLRPRRLPLDGLAMSL